MTLRSAIVMLSVALAFACSAGEDPTSARVIEVKRQDLVVDVEVTGMLKALDSDLIGVPPVAGVWDFKIARMVAEGTEVKAGAEVIAFDTSDIEKRLRDADSEVMVLSQQLGKGRAEASLAKLNDGLDRELKEAEARKAALRADKPPDLTAELKLRQAVMDRELAESEVKFQLLKEQSNRRREEADLGGLQGRLVRAQEAVAQAKEAMAAMSVKARRPGTAVYRQSGRGEKKKVGDELSRGDVALEIASLARMAAEGQVDEVDASRVRTGQRVGLRLEANPNVEHEAVVDRIATLVRTESSESRIKVAKLDIRLAVTDAAMRPGMRFRGRIEVARLSKVLQLPLAAVRSTPRGAEVVRVAGGKTEAVLVKLGRRSRDVVEVLGGVNEGDRIAIESPKRSGDPSGGSS